jgi:CHAT domain-containing protein
MLLGPEHGYVFAVRGGSGAVLARRVGLSETQAQDLVKRVRAGIELGADGVPGRFDTQAAQALYELLLAPLAPALEGARTVLVAADGPLLSIPFGLLLTGRTTPDNLAAAPWLIRRHAIVHMPAAQTLVALRGAGSGVASAAPLAYAGFGDPVMPTEMQLRRSFPPDRCAGDARAARELRPLPGTRVEVLAAQRLTGARPEAVKLGSAFTAAAIRGGGLERYRVVHFATHALLPGELSCLQEPALMASTPAGAADANGAFIPTSAFLALKLDADLVILSACNTGTVLGGEATSGTGGEGLSAMARSFFFAGARGVLATHWSVSDEAAELTVTIALKRQAEHGASSAVALRTAQLALIEEAGKRLPAAYAHPFFWAPFALIGDGRRDAASR